MLRTIYEIVTADGREWGVKKRGNLNNTSNHTTKAEAIEKGQRLARATQPSQLIIRLADGSIEKEYTYGQDPPQSPG